MVAEGTEWGNGRAVKGPGKWGATLLLMETGSGGDPDSINFSECLSSVVSFVVLLSCQSLTLVYENISRGQVAQMKALMTLKAISSRCGCLKISVYI